MSYQELWYELIVEEIAASKFKITCLSVIERVRKTRKPITGDTLGKPVAEIVPANRAEVSKEAADGGTVRFRDIVSLYDASGCSLELSPHASGPRTIGALEDLHDSRQASWRSLRQRGDETEGWS